MSALIFLGLVAVFFGFVLLMFWGIDEGDVVAMTFSALGIVVTMTLVLARP